MSGPAARELDDLKATERQLERFSNLGSLDPDLLDVLLQEIATRRRRLIGRKETPARGRQPFLPFPTTASSAPSQVESKILTALPVDAKPRAATSAPTPILLKVAEATVPTSHPVVPPYAAPVPAPAPAPLVVPPAPPRRSLRELLASFMEQRNIFWGELLGGLLIVGCSIALVISLWTTGKLEKIPFAPFMILSLITAALFGVGWYTLRHWKLESTSRGLLVIATLLVPLNFMVAAGLHGRESSGWEIPLEVSAVIVFAWLTSLAGGVLFTEPRWLLPLAIVGAGGSQLLFSWLITGERDPSWLMLLGLIPVACYATSCGLTLAGTFRRPAAVENQSRSLFGFLGVSVFAITIALGFLAYLAGERLFGGDISPALGHVAMLVALAAWPILIYGLTVHQALANNPKAGTWRTTGTAVALTGMIVMLAAGLLAWPSPTPLLLVCIFDFAIISYIAFRYELPIAQAAALPCLAVAFLVCFHLTGGLLGTEIFGSAQSGIFLAGLFVLLALTGEIIVRTGRKSHGVCYVLGSGLVAFWSLLLVTFPTRGIENPGPAMWIYALCGAVSLMMNTRWRRPLVTSTGLALIVGSTLWTLWWRFVQVERFERDANMISVPRWGTVLAIEALIMVGFSWLIHRRSANRADRSPSRPSAFQEPLARSAEATTFLAILAALAGGLWSNLKSQGISSWVPAHILTAFCLMAAYLLLAAMQRRKGMARLAGVMLIGGVVAITGFVVTIQENLSLPAQLPMLAMSIAAAGAFLAAMAVHIRSVMSADVDVTQGSVPWYGVLVAWRGPATLSAILSFATASISLHPGGSVVPAYTAFLLATTAFLLAWGYQSRALTWLGCSLGLGSIAYAFAHHQAKLGLPLEWQWPLLDYCTIALVISLLLKWRVGSITALQRVRNFFAEPIGQSALVFSLPALFVVLVGSETSVSEWWGLCWLAGLWLAISVEKRQPALFTAFQAVLVAAVLFGVTAWLEVRGWVPQFSNLLTGSWGPQIWQCYGIGLALLSLLWRVARIILEPSERAQKLLNPGWPAVDSLVLGALVIGQALLAVRGISLGIVEELWGRGQVTILDAQAFGSGAWLLIGLTTLAFLAGLWERRAALAVIGLIIIAAIVPVLMAGMWGVQENTVASALRWTCALAYLLASLFVWNRRALSGLATRAGWHVVSTDQLPSIARPMLLVLMAGPVLGLTLLLAVFGFLGVSPAGPTNNSFFHQLGWLPSAVIPAAIVCMTLIGHAVRERSQAHFFGAGLVANLTLTSGLIVWHSHANLPLTDWWIVLLQANVVAASAVAMLWQAWRFGMQGESPLGIGQTKVATDAALQSTTTCIPFRSLLTWQVAIGLLGISVLLVVPLIALFLSPADPPLPPEFSGLGNWLALVSVTAAAAWFLREFAPARLVHLFGCFGLGLGILAACYVSPFDTQGTWLTYHVLTVAWIIHGFAMLVAGLRLTRQSSIRDSQSSHFLGWLHAIGLMILALGLRSSLGDPGRLYWSSAPVLAVSLLFGAVAIWQRRPLHVYVSGFLINVVGSLIWVAGDSHPWEGLAYVNMLCFAVAGGLWIGLELWLQKRTPSVDLRGGREPFAHLAITLGLVLCGAMALLTFLSGCQDLHALAIGPVAWTALAALTAATVLLLWDASADFSRLGLYAIGLSGILFTLAGTHQTAPNLLWSFAIAAALYVLLTALLAHWLPGRDKLRTMLGLPKLSTTWPEPWFLPAQFLMGTIVVALTLWMSVSFESLAARLAAPAATLILVTAFTTMRATISPALLRMRLPIHTPALEYVTLATGTIAVVETGWAMGSPTGHEVFWLWLHRNVVLMVALSFMTMLYGVLLRRIFVIDAHSVPSQSSGLIWAECGRRMGPWLGLLACVVLGMVLIHETIFYDGLVAVNRLVAVMLKLDGAADMKAAWPDEPMSAAAIAVIACAIVGLIVAGLCFAVLPDRDPLGLSERGRKGYVYAAEVLLVLLFVHFKITVPGLFKRSIFIQYWPFVFMAIAFLGAGLSEYFRRKQLRVLAEPLGRTGVCLPLLPVLAYWVLPSAGEYALIWFFAGLLYGVMSIFKRSWRFALLGAVVANMGLWVLLQDSGLYFWKHPQMWVIPLAMVVLVAEQLNQDRLTQRQSAGIRYFALIAIYVSSTADMFIAGLGESWQMPLILMILSVLGVLAGMLLRVRAFLYMGTSFLGLVIATMIWHAGIDRHEPWVLWSSGIVLGLAIYALFMYFEKRRQNVLHLVEQLKKWD